MDGAWLAGRVADVSEGGAPRRCYTVIYWYMAGGDSSRKENLCVQVIEVEGFGGQSRRTIVKRLARLKSRWFLLLGRYCGVSDVSLWIICQTHRLGNWDLTAGLLLLFQGAIP